MAFSVGTMQLTLSIAIMQLPTSVAIMQLEVSAILMPVKIFATNMWVTIFIEIMQVGVSVVKLNLEPDKEPFWIILGSEFGEKEDASCMDVFSPKLNIQNC